MKNTTQTKKKTSKQEKELQLSYVERALYTYLKKTIIGGYEFLLKKYPSLFIYIISIISFSTILSAAHSLGYINLFDQTRILIFLILETATSFIIIGFMGIFIKKEEIQKIMLFILLFIIIILTTYIYPQINTIYSKAFVTYTKLAYIFTWVIISSINIFYILLSFHASISYRILNLGNSPNRMFFQWLHRLGAVITLFMALYLYIQKGIYTQIIAIWTAITALFLIYNFYHLPETHKKDTFEQKEKKAATMNFKQTLGFYNWYIIFNLSQSYNTGGRISNIWVELIILALNSFFIINSITRKVDNIEDLDRIKKKKFRFKITGEAAMKFKKKVGEQGLVFIAIGIALGYYAVILDSFLNVPLPFMEILGESEEVPLNVLYHRAILFIGIIWINITLLFSKRFKRYATNRYTVGHALRMLGDLFKPQVNENMAKMEENKQKIAEWGRKFFNIKRTEKKDDNNTT